ncbi:MAG TPA: hypothetical protein VGO45_14650 [Bacteroidia bacterium]|jgi:hypothetical protein|nr:hypothetical protein [Bacteroidia bacterium]
MNLAQRQAAFEGISAFEKLELGVLAAKLYPDQKIEAIQIGEYSLAELIFTLNRAFKQLRAELESNDWRTIPATYNHPEVGNGELSGQIAAIISNLTSSNSFPATISNLNWLVGFERAAGFWNKSEMKIHNVDLLKLTETQTLLNLLKEELKGSISLANSEIMSLTTEKNNLTTFITAKQAELKAITDSLASSQNDTQAIATLLNTSTVNNEKINSVLVQQNARLIESTNLVDAEKKTFEKQKEDFSSFEKTIETRIEEIDMKNDKFNQHLLFIESKDGYIKQKEKEINDLTGFAAGVSLFHTFDERKRQLETPVLLWGIAVFLTALGTVAGIWGIFYLAIEHGTATQNPVSWAMFLLNSLKSMPLIILLYFVIRQYSKVRAFQEEYAFKSSVALTINAYADKLQDPKNKERLILDSVQRVYQSPKGMRQRGFSLFGNKGTKEFNDTVKTMTEAIKEIKSK